MIYIDVNFAIAQSLVWYLRGSHVKSVQDCLDVKIKKEDMMNIIKAQYANPDYLPPCEDYELTSWTNRYIDNCPLVKRVNEGNQEYIKFAEKYPEIKDYYHATLAIACKYNDDCYFSRRLWDNVAWHVKAAGYDAKDYTVQQIHNRRIDRNTTI